MNGLIFILPDTMKTAQTEFDIIVGVLVTIIGTALGILFIIFIIDVQTIGRKYGFVISFTF